MGADAVTGQGYDSLSLIDAVVAGGLILKTAPGLLHTLSVNKSPTTTGSLDLYDGADNTGKVIGKVTLTQAAGTAFVPTTLEYDLVLATGLYVEVTTLAGYDFTITYK